MRMESLGRVGVWSPAPLWVGAADTAAELEELGYGALWLGWSPPGDLAVIDPLLAATRSMVVGTSIVNIWTEPADLVTASYRRIDAAHPGRFVLGLGSSHKSLVEAATGQRYERPYSRLAAYLDELDLPGARLALAALGPRTLALAAERTLGALPYLVTTEHTARARATMGPDALLVPELHVLLETDPGRAREAARAALAPYLGQPNYLNSWRRLGFTEDDLTGGGSDRLVDALVAWGDEGAVASRVAEHLAAGATQVAVQVVTPDRDNDLPALRRLAAALPTGRVRG